MKSTRSLIYLILSCFLTCLSCKSAHNEPPRQEELAIAQADAIPADAIPFHYLNDSIKIILIDGVLNGTDSITFMWDTGAAYSIFPSAYKSSLEDRDSIGFKIDGQTLIYQDKIEISDKYNPKWAIVGLNLFKDKIVEISYDRKYLRVLPDTDRLDEYECISCKEKGLLFIPITVHAQGKIFHIEDVLLDTGFNGAFITNGKFLPGVNLNNASTLYAGRPGQKKNSVHQIMADSISASTESLTNIEILVLDKKGLPNLLGNGFFSHFSVVFDFKNQNLYLKPLKK